MKINSIVVLSRQKEPLCIMGLHDVHLDAVGPDGVHLTVPSQLRVFKSITLDGGWTPVKKFLCAELPIFEDLLHSVADYFRKRFPNAFRSTDFRPNGSPSQWRQCDVTLNLYSSVEYLEFILRGNMRLKYPLIPFKIHIYTPYYKIYVAIYYNNIIIYMFVNL